MRKNIKKRKVSADLQSLEKDIGNALIETGLIEHIRFHHGNLEHNKYDYNPDNGDEREIDRGDSSYIEYRRTENPKSVYGNCKLLRDFLYEFLTTQSRSEICGIDYYTAHNGRVPRVGLILNTIAEIPDQGEFTREIFEDLKKALGVYIAKYKNQQ